MSVVRPTCRLCLRSFLTVTDHFYLPAIVLPSLSPPRLTALQIANPTNILDIPSKVAQRWVCWCCSYLVCVVECASWMRRSRVFRVRCKANRAVGRCKIVEPFVRSASASRFQGTLSSSSRASPTTCRSESWTARCALKNVSLLRDAWLLKIWQGRWW